MTEELDTRLTVTQRFGAFLDARGYSPADIAERLNIHIGTVSNWRAMPKYIAERERAQDDVADKLEPIINHARMEMLQLHRETGTLFVKALAELEEMLKACVPETNFPNYPVRIEALKIIQKMLAAPSPLIAKAITQAEELNGQGPLGPAVVKLDITLRNADGEEVVAEDGSWSEDQDGDGDADQHALNAGDDPGEGNEGAGAGDEPVVVLPDCTCSNPAQWLEASCPLHGAEVRARLEAEGLEIPG